MVGRYNIIEEMAPSLHTVLSGPTDAMYDFPLRQRQAILGYVGKCVTF